jgi:hypothetical protein
MAVPVIAVRATPVVTAGHLRVKQFACSPYLIMSK